MIPASAITAKLAKELRAGEMGFLLARDTSFPVIGGITQDDVPVGVIFDGERVRLEAIGAIRETVLIVEKAEIVVDPQSGRKAAPGRQLGCPILSGDVLFFEADYERDFYQVALGPVAEPPKGERIAFPQWRIVLRHDGTEYEILSRSSKEV